MSVREVVVTKKPLRDYLIDVAVSFQEGIEVIVIKGYGKFISKAVDLYNAISRRMKDSVELIGITIDSDVVKGKIKPYIVIKIKRRY